MDPVDSSSSSSQHSSTHSSRHSNWAALVQNYSETADDLEADMNDSELDDIDIASKLDCLHIEIVDPCEPVKSIDIKRPRFKADTPSPGTAPSLPLISIDHDNLSVQDLSKPEKLELRRPFHKWMRTIHRRATQQLTALSTDRTLQWQQLDSGSQSPNAVWRRPHHRKSSSGSSFAFVSAVRSASASVASVSAVTRSRRKIIRSQRLSSTECSSRASILGPRASEDSGVLEPQGLADIAATERSLRRRQVLEELISTEEAYIGDVRFLMNVYVTILASLPTEHVGLRSSINRNLTEIIELHEEILGELHRAVPHSEYTQVDINTPSTTSLNPTHAHGYGHRRWASLSAVPENNLEMSWLENVPGMLSEPQVAAEVSKVFAKKINRLFIYEEYGAAYEIMIKDIASAQQVMPDWETYQREPPRRAKKSLTTNDLLVKPIQRICKYPLLFSELLKYTPVSDCPNSHMEVDSVLTRLREATAEINRASDDVGMKATLEKTWLLQDRLVFPDRKLDAFSKKQIRSFGHVRLCGTLYVCWQTKDSVDGQYMVCLLYRDVLCLASAGKVDPIYTILACININEVRIEDTDNGRGLQCHTAPFSWKLVFECDHQMYEMIMTACTPREEMVWRSRLSRPAKETPEVRDPNVFSSLYLNIKSLGIVFGKPGKCTVARRISIHRATTVGPKSPLCQVVLKNTSVVRDAPNNTSVALSINRSQSLLTTNARLPVLAPARSERARLEALLADVWSREILPFPGMTARSRSENLVRSSASSVIRKLSVASIASSFTKRSGSLNQRGGSSEHIIINETSKRRDSGMNAAKSEDTDVEAEHNRKTKRQRTGYTPRDGKPNETAVLEPTGLSGVLRRRVPTNAEASETNTETIQSPAIRALSTSILLPRRSMSSRKTGSPSIETEKASKSSTEKVRKNCNRRPNIRQNESGGGLRRFFMIRRDS
ncbi:hypothetical protein PT974_11739 [Cladobotryum mycophilum]|uniref:DH domain-containing protein n=1 Tax=Cladobotryum mycophilum TaxID=491253 RepID=A0ABR0S612_9HYPO